MSTKTPQTAKRSVWSFLGFGLIGVLIAIIAVTITSWLNSLPSELTLGSQNIVFQIPIWVMIAVISIGLPGALLLATAVSAFLEELHLIRENFQDTAMGYTFSIVIWLVGLWLSNRQV